MREPASPLTRHLGDLARHMAWADSMVWDAVRAAPDATADPKIADTLHHIHMVQHLFLQGWTRTGLSVRDRAEFTTLEDIVVWGRNAHRGILTFLDSAELDTLSREFRVPWAASFEERAKQPAGVHTMGESVLQVVLHSQHHRGQLCTRLRDVGGTPPTIDLIVWFWLGRPAPTWEPARA